MLRDLETQKFVDRFDCFGIRRVDFHLGAELRVLGHVGNFAFQALHRFHSGRIRRVDEHRDGKIALAEHPGDGGEMIANGFLTGLIGRIVRLDFDASAIRQEMEMVAGHMMTEAHALISALVHRVMMSRVRSRTRRGRRVFSLRGG